MFFLVQHWVWLTSPMWEWQSLWQRTQTKSDAGLSAWAAAFLLILFSLCCWASVSSKLERPFCTVCLRLTVWGLLFPSCSGQCSRLLGPSCTHLWIAAVVCLWEVFPAWVLHRGGLWGSVHRPCARCGRASAYVSVSAVWTCWCIQLFPGQYCLGPCPARWCSECVGGCAYEKHWAFAPVGHAMSRTRCHTGECSRRRLCRSGSLCARSACCCSMLSLSVWSWW